MNKLKQIYEQKYKLLLLIPFLLVVGAIIQIGVQYSTTGDFVNKGISLKGGSTITIDQEISNVPSINIGEFQQYLNQELPLAEINVRTINSLGEIISVVVDSDIQEQSEVDNLLTIIGEKTSLPPGSYSVETFGSSLGESFFRQTIIALLVAFILMGIVVFIYFKLPIPSLVVILAAFSDIVVTLAVFNLTGIKLSTAGIAAFLMLIGYSVDTDILLTTRVLKRREGTIMERIYGAMKTGLTMAITTIAAVGVSLLLVESEVIKQIMLILFIGLIVDIIMTWIQNAGLLRLYLHKKDAKH
ncbi:MAG TPA: protein translocase subunit SecF [Candidatus Nanoarchaeia archaeon]|nr:protein translocase subunit SecF [Candidatus Nanoarchaeia archaeon]